MAKDIFKFTSDGCRIDDLMTNGLKILQHPEKYCFTTDAVILSNFARVNKRTNAVDMCSGSGIIAILLTGKYGAASCECVEIQQYFAEMSQASIELNNLSERITVHCADIKDCFLKTGYNRFDLAVCNPPYTKAGDGASNIEHSLALCRHEIAVDIDSIACSAAKLLKFGGRFCIVHQAERLTELFSALIKYKLMPKRMRLVYGKSGQNASVVLIEAKAGAKSGLIVEPALILCNSDGSETEELKSIYSRVKE